MSKYLRVTTTEPTRHSYHRKQILLKSTYKMSITSPRLAEIRQLLAACGWSLEIQQLGDKTSYVVRDTHRVPRRSFVPIDRLHDYVQGVFDAQEWDR